MTHGRSAKPAKPAPELGAPQTRVCPQLSPGEPSRVLADRHPRERQGRCGGGPGTCFYRPSLELFQHFRSVFPTRTNQGHVAAFYCFLWPDLTVNTCLLIHALKMYYCINTSFQQTKYKQYRSVEGEKPSLSTPCLSPPIPGGAWERSARYRGTPRWGLRGTRLGGLTLLTRVLVTSFPTVPMGLLPPAPSCSKAGMSHLFI